MRWITPAGLVFRLIWIRPNELHDTIAELVELHREELEQQLPGCFKRYGPRSKQAGQLQRTAAGVPRRDAKAIKEHLREIAKAAEEPIRPPRNKDGRVTDSVKYWTQHRDLHPFIQAYVQYAEQAKLAAVLQAAQPAADLPTISATGTYWPHELQ